MKRHLRYGLLAFALAVPLVWSLDGSAKSVDGSDTVLRDLNIARQMLVLGKTEQAIAMYEDLYREHLADPRTYWGLAKAYASQGMDREHLIPLLEKRLSEAPSDSRAAGSSARRTRGSASTNGPGRCGAGFSAWAGRTRAATPK